MARNLKAPFSTPDVQTPAYAATIGVDITNYETFIEPGELTGNLTLNLDSVNDELPDGSTITIIFDADGSNRTVTFGTSLTGTSLTVSANTKQGVVCKKYGSGFYVVSNYQVA